MRHLLFLTIIIISASCGSKHADHDSSDLSYSVDTVIIDSKGRLLDLKRNILNSDVDHEKSLFFLYNGFDHSIDKINLDQLEVVDNFSLEMEGPDGTGEHVNSFNLVDDSLFFIKSFSQSAIINKNGSLVQKFDWANSSGSNGLEYGQIPRVVITANHDYSKIFGLSYDQKNHGVFLDILSAQENLVNRNEIDPKKSYGNFILELDDPQNRTFMDPYVYMIYENNYIIISHQYSNEIILFNAEGEFVQTVHYAPKLTPKRVKDLNGINVTSMEHIQKTYQHFLEQVRFGPPVWDSDKKRYLRLSASRVFSDSQKEEGSFLPEIKEVKVYLSVFDAEFNLISELAIPELSTEYVTIFTKDGKLWVYQNFSDELGFIVIDVEAIDS